ncbi:MAG TPA: polysaccharide deacetylase family protein [Gemmatimonadales bacterium]|nr:polysaccharide deacetylase family protein [Gemmatimonadales bacterium]
MAPPVLCYHRVGGPLELGVTRVSPKTFARQMHALARAGWSTLTLGQFAAAAAAGSDSAHPTPHSAFLLTFDDGYAELAEHAYPVLREVGFTATTFLITDFVGRPNAWDIQYTRRPLTHLDWTSIEGWRARGLEFASHTATHPRLTWADDPRVADELGRSRRTLVERLGPESGAAVAYPFGAVDDRVARAAGAAGYALGFGGVRGIPGDALRVPRVPVYLWDSWDVPFGLRADVLGTAGTFVAHVANRCAVGTTVMRGVRDQVSGVRGLPGTPDP